MKRLLICQRFFNHLRVTATHKRLFCPLNPSLYNRRGQRRAKGDIQAQCDQEGEERILGIGHIRILGIGLELA